MIRKVIESIQSKIIIQYHVLESFSTLSKIPRLISNSMQSVN